MQLPKLVYPTYHVTLSNGKRVEYRPITAKEEKVMLMAATSQDPEEIASAVKSTIAACAGVDIDTVPFFDADRLFIMIRAKSIGETEDLNFVCNNTIIEGTKCGAVFPVQINFNNINLENLKKTPFDVDLGQGVHLHLNYPSYAQLKQVEEFEDDLEKVMYLLPSCIEGIWMSDNRITSKEWTPDQIREWVETIAKPQMDVIREFYADLPHFNIKIEKECPKCGFNHQIEYKDFNTSFF